MSRDKSVHQERVELFMAKAGQAVPDRPTIPDEETCRLRAKLILEEAMETIEALGFQVVMKPFDGEIEIGRKTHEPDLEQVVDGCADIQVVTTGTLSAFGVADADIMIEVDNNNLSKFGPGGYRREDGKWMKPPTWTPPDIKGILEDQKK